MSQNKKSFIRRLSTEQITTFMDSLYPKKLCFSYDFFFTDLDNSECIRVSITNSTTNFTHTIHLQDFDTSISIPDKWIRYLYKIFGDEYKQAYLDKCATIFDEA